jgi:uncharacterized membrane protein YhhN
VNARETAGSVSGVYDDALPPGPRWILRNADTVNVLAERVFKALVLAVCGWALIEAPLELDAFDGHAGLLALLLSKLVVSGIGFAAIAKARFARKTFAFICGASVLAIAPSLPIEFNQSLATGIISAVECFIKAACVMAFGISSSRERQSRQK